MSNTSAESSKRIIIFALWGLAFYPIYPELIYTWLNHSDNSHGLLVPFISIYYLWQKRKELREAKIESAAWGGYMLLATILVYLVSLAGNVAFISRLMVVFSLIALIIFSFGWQYFKVIAFPLLFLVFMVPLPVSLVSRIALPLQMLITSASASLIKAFSIPVYQEGNILYFAETQLEVAEACSGIRSLVSLSMLGVLFSYMTKKGWVMKLFLVFSTIPIAMGANLLRVSGTGILAHFYGGQAAQGFLHEFSGVAVFIFGLVVLSGEFLFLNRDKKKVRDG